MTHIDDPVPLLPLTEWGYRSHAGEVFISKAELPPAVEDIRLCEGDEDPECIAGRESRTAGLGVPDLEGSDASMAGFKAWWGKTRALLKVPPRIRIWQLFFAHRDYFWRLGLCLPSNNAED